MASGLNSLLFCSIKHEGFIGGCSTNDKKYQILLLAREKLLLQLSICNQLTQTFVLLYLKEIKLLEFHEDLYLDVLMSSMILMISHVI